MLTDGQKTLLAVGIARAHQLPIITAIALANTVARLLPTIPADVARRCHCGTAIGPCEQWCSRACFRADEGHDRELEDVG
jgi:hypothetical protein